MSSGSGGILTLGGAEIVRRLTSTFCAMPMGTAVL